MESPHTHPGVLFLGGIVTGWFVTGWVINGWVYDIWSGVLLQYHYDIRMVLCYMITLDNNSIYLSLCLFHTSTVCDIHNFSEIQKKTFYNQNLGKCRNSLFSPDLGKANGERLSSPALGKANGAFRPLLARRTAQFARILARLTALFARS